MGVFHFSAQSRTGLMSWGSDDANEPIDGSPAAATVSLEPAAVSKDVKLLILINNSLNGPEWVASLPMGCQHVPPGLMSWATTVPLAHGLSAHLSNSLRIQLTSDLLPRPFLCLPSVFFLCFWVLPSGFWLRPGLWLGWWLALLGCPFSLIGPSRRIHEEVMMTALL